MRYILVFLLAALCSLPSFAQTGMVDNCCQTGRACETDSEWIQGYYDYQNDMCDSPMMSPMATMDTAPPASFSFVGQGRVKKSARFTLTRGKWDLNMVTGERWTDLIWVNIAQVDAEGEWKTDGHCLTTAWQWHNRNGWSSWWRGFGYSGYEFVVLHPCEVVFQVSHWRHVNQVRDMDWKIFIQKTDGNF